jgi:mRNA interferase RelE/StbE
LAWHINISETAKKQLQKLDRHTAQRLVNYLRERVLLHDNPRIVGAALQGNRLGELWKYRVGDYRIIVRIKDQELEILVVEVGHRREVYR